MSEYCFDRNGVLVIEDSMKFLLIDDDVDDATIFFEALRGINERIFCVHECSSCHAFCTATMMYPKPDLIFLDINMPIINGWELLRKFKADVGLRHIPVVIYSTSPDERDVVRALNEGAVCFFEKPQSFVDLRDGLEIIATMTRNGAIESMASVFSPRFAR